MPFKILISVEAIGSATGDRAFDISLVRFGVFAISSQLRCILRILQCRKQEDEASAASSYLLEFMSMEIALATVKARERAPFTDE